MLSPQFYIVKKEQLPVKYSFAAKKLAPSILEDLLPTEIGYEFEVKKVKDGWLLFAYNPKEIENFLQKCCDIKPYQIGNIYFADQLNEVLQKVPVGVDENFALTLIDDFATIVPRDILESEKYAKFSNRLRPKKAFRFKSATKQKGVSKIDKGYLVASILTILLSATFIAEGVSYKKASAAEFEKINLIFDKYPQLQTKLARDSIKAKYTKIEKRQRAIRELINRFSSLTSINTLLDKLELKKDSLIATFTTLSSKDLQKIKTLSKESGLKVVSVQGNKITLQGALK